MIASNIGPGAEFLRADLHIHSYGEEGSFDVTDTSMTPENIVDKAIEKGLKIISITDHNEIGNVKPAIKYSEGKGILVIPGIEVSTLQGHLLVYFDTFENLSAFRGKLTIAPDKKTCNQGIVQCLDIALAFNGFGVLAHIEVDSGFEKMIGRFGPQIEEVFVHPNLLGLEIKKKESFKLYTDDDDIDTSSPNRKALVKLRRKKLELSDDSVLPKLMSSDSHKLESLGKNAEDANRLTRIKADKLNFQALKNALISYSSRIRIEDLVPEVIPKFQEVKLNGGLFKDQTIKLSKNLTCIIGGRGTGKSTLLESIKQAAGNGSELGVVDSEVWPDTINLKYQDEANQITEFGREKHAPNVNLTDPNEGILRVPIEHYGQGDATEILKKSDENPFILLKLLDSYMDVEILKTEEEEVKDSMLKVQSDIEKLKIEVSTKSETERHLKSLKEKLKHLTTQKVSELVENQRALLRERELRQNLITDIKDLIDTYKTILSDRAVFDDFADLKDDEIIVGKDNFKKVQKIVSEFALVVEGKSGELTTELKNKVEELRKELKSWKEKEKGILDKIEDKKKELNLKGIPFDIGQINQLTRDEIEYDNKLRKLKSQEKELVELEKEREALLKKRIELKNKIFYTRSAFAKDINKNLKSSVDGFAVTVKYDQGVLSPDFQEKLKQQMDFRTVVVPKSKFIADNISPVDFAKGLRTKNLNSLKSVVDADGKRLIEDNDLKRIIDKLGLESRHQDYEVLQYEDRPSIKVTKKVENSNGKAVVVTRPISQLSLGQQQSVLLAILLQSKSKFPLLIDQPEDNLDSEFIFKTVVANLRKIKERRQVIIVTHNPNIAVLGDAELIVPLKSTSTKSHIVSPGSIDDPQTRDSCCQILEGGSHAFKTRQKIYGFKDGP